MNDLKIFKNLPKNLQLNLPDAPKFVSHPPSYTADEMIAFCEKMLPFWNSVRCQNPPLPYEGAAFKLLDLKASKSSDSKNKDD